MKIYLAGVIQGSHQGASNENQNYRDRIKNILLENHPEAEIVCPLELYPKIGRAHV